MRARLGLIQCSRCLADYLKRAREGQSSAGRVMLRSECETAQLIHCAETGDAANLSPDREVALTVSEWMCCMLLSEEIHFLSYVSYFIAKMF